MMRSVFGNDDAVADRVGGVVERRRWPIGRIELSVCVRRLNGVQRFDLVFIVKRFQKLCFSSRADIAGES